MTLSVDDFGEGFGLAAQVDEKIEARRICEYMQTSLKSLLDALETAPKRAIRQLEVMGEDERRKVVYEWNQTEAEYRADACVHELFEEQVRKRPEAVAVVSEEAWVTYEELNRRANRLAHYLREEGVGPDSRVGIGVERGIEMMVGLLGILKAGGAYVPLDPTYPQERLSYMVKDSEPVVVLTQKHLAGMFAGMGVRIIDIEDSGEWEQRPERDLERGSVGLNPGHLAYVIYTSGSTGIPKGVAVQHRSLCNTILATSRPLQLQVEDRTALVSGQAFDISLWELLTAPTVGGAVEIWKREQLLDVDKATGRMSGVTVLHAVPTLMRELVSGAIKSGNGQQVRVALTGGDQVPGSLIQDMKEVFHRAVIGILYGPTETAILAASFECERGKTETNAAIGRPIANARIYILDEEGEPVPVGVAGELYIGGAGVARGYWNRPKLTAERFVADPYVGDGKARMYRTGDLGRWLEDGNIEFMGLDDFQVKIRGYRIELGEIEARLAEHEGVKEAVVVAREEEGDKRLVAYYTTEASEEAGAEQLRAHVSAKLPEYMVPAAYVRLEKLPLTPNGKLDRKALPKPEEDAYAMRRYEEPEGEVERAIAAVWQEVLKVERVGRHDDFFVLGGHSLMAMQVIARIRYADEEERGRAGELRRRG